MNHDTAPLEIKSGDLADNPSNDTNSDDLRALHEMAPKMTDEDFKSLPDQADNCIYLDAGDFPELAGESDGAPIMLVIKGQIGKPDQDGKIKVDVYDAAEIHGAYPDRGAPLGEGGRFEALKESLVGRPGIRNPGALAAYLGRKKYGPKKFSGLSAMGRKNG